MKLGVAILYVSHDLAVVGSIADRIAVMYAGRIVEEGAARDVMHAPKHPLYARARVVDSRLPRAAPSAR